MNGANNTLDAGNLSQFTNSKTMTTNSLFRKGGQSNIVYRSIQSKRMLYMKDIYITLLDIKWRWALMIVFAGFSLFCLIFSVVYYLTSYIHGDFDHLNDPNHTPCFTGVKTFWDSVMFSIETQSTVGYGALHPNSQCGVTIPVIFLQDEQSGLPHLWWMKDYLACLFVVDLQLTSGFLLETFLLGFIFMKVTRPKYRKHTLIFSNKACVCMEDKNLKLQIRVGDIRNTHLIGAHLYGILIKRHVTAEKCVYPLYQHEIELTAHGLTNQMFLFYPLVVSHVITPESPLYDLTPEGLLRESFELLVILEGTIESTGEIVQAMTSISNKDVSWGCRYVGTEEYDNDKEKWCINFNNFNLMTPAETPRCSARDLIEKASLHPESRATLQSTAM